MQSGRALLPIWSFLPVAPIGPISWGSSPKPEVSFRRRMDQGPHLRSQLGQQRGQADTEPIFGERTFLTPVLVPVERGLYRIAIDETREQHWIAYTVVMLLFNAAVHKPMPKDHNERQPDWLTFVSMRDSRSKTRDRFPRQSPLH